MIRRFPTIDTVIEMNAVVTGLDVGTVRQSVKVGLLDSALHAPLAGFGDADLYPDDHQRLGVLCSRIVRNHPFLDGNKRTAFLAMMRTAHLNDVAMDFDDQDDVADRIEALAAGTLDEDDFCEWLRPFV